MPEIMKMCWTLSKLCLKYYWFLFFPGHGVYCFSSNVHLKAAVIDCLLIKSDWLNMLKLPLFLYLCSCIVFCAVTCSSSCDGFENSLSVHTQRMCISVVCVWKHVSFDISTHHRYLRQRHVFRLCVRECIQACIPKSLLARYVLKNREWNFNKLWLLV